MFHRKLPYRFFSGRRLALLMIVTLSLLSVLAVEAQCGSQASSCKNCHETQAQLPVNNDGNGWHESHAFGDFCYICHAGNQQATEIESSHAGIVPPLSDVNASCQMCHADDLTERTQVYASILGVDLNGGSTPSDSTTQDEDVPSDDFWGSEAVDNTPTADVHPPVVAADTQDSECIALSPDVVIDDASFEDYTQRYDEIVLGKTPVNMGNVVLAVLIGLLVVGGGGFVLLNEIRLSTSHTEMGKIEGEYPLEVIEMLPALAALKVGTLKALKKILSNPQKSDQILGLIDTVISDEPEEPQS